MIEVQFGKDIENVQYKNDPLYKAFSIIREGLAPKISDMNTSMEDTTFFVKTDTQEDFIVQSLYSDAHSSPEYFGQGYSSIDMSLKDQSLEDLYKEVAPFIQTKKSFFVGI